MKKYDDFDLDIKKVKKSADDGGATPNATIGPICTAISSLITGSILQGCTDKCTDYCTKNCF
ncbi:TPA: FDLD family class I lanthipeptide [Streptococcus pyogenes]